MRIFITILDWAVAVAIAVLAMTYAPILRDLSVREVIASVILYGVIHYTGEIFRAWKEHYR